MINEKTVKELSELFSPSDNVVTLCFNRDMSEKRGEGMRAELQDLLSVVKERGLDADAKKIEKEIKKVNFDHTKFVVAISSAENKLFKLYTFNVALESGVRIAGNVHITPLLRLLDEYKRYAFVHIDKEQMRLFLVHLGVIEESEEFRNKVQGHHKKGGWSQARFQRHTENQVQQNLRDAARAVYELFKKNIFERLIIAGTTENTKHFKEILHGDLKSRISGCIPSEPHLSDSDILSLSMSMAEVIEREEESILVEEMINNLGDGNRAVRGIEKVLDVVKQGKALTLLLDESYQEAGSRCKADGMVTPSGIEELQCEGEKEIVSTIIPDVVLLAFQKGARIEFIKENELLKQNKSIGAFLRF